MREILQDSINRILGEQVTPALLRAGEDGQWQTALQDLLDQGGFTRALASEDFGGVGAGWFDVYPIVLACGHYALPLPLPESLVASWLLTQCGIQVPTGSLSLGETTPDTRIERTAQGWRMHGALPQVPWGRAIDYVVTTAKDGDQTRVLLLECQHARITPDQNMAREARDRLDFANVTPAAVAPLADGVDANPIHTYGAMIRSAQIAGALDRVVELCVQYANDRTQFGKPIGKFQAIQQQLAVLASQAASVGIAAEYAFSQADCGQVAFATLCAKQRASEVAGTGAAIAHAVHGAIGFTYEHSLHYLTRRLWAWRSEFGTHAYWAQRLGEEVCSNGGNSVWPMITAG